MSAQCCLSLKFTLCLFNIELFSWHIISFISMVFISPIDVKKKPDWQLGTSLQITCWESSISSRPKTKSFIIISILTGTQYNTWPSGLCNCVITIFWEKTKNVADWLCLDSEKDTCAKVPEAVVDPMTSMWNWSRQTYPTQLGTRWSRLARLGGARFGQQQ